MILSLIDYSKYKAQEANFKFWDELFLFIILRSEYNFATPEHDFLKRRNISLILYIIKYKNQT